MDRKLVRSWISSRPLQSHKGNFGHLLLLGGSAKKPGSIMLSGYAALRTGVGLVTVALPEKAFQKFPKDFLELMFEPLSSSQVGEFSKISKKTVSKILEKKTALAIGPGMGTSKGSAIFFKSIISSASMPMVLDADALNILAQDPRLLKLLSGKPVILTPHVGEMARLTKLTVKKVNEKRLEVARAFVTKYKVFLLLKGHQTLMLTPEGKVFVNPTGNPGMATAGMGDTLTGIIGSLLAQGYATEKAMILGCWIHGRAGDRVAEVLGDRGMVARDVANQIPSVYKELLR